jgi:hypothetical protein
MANQTLLLSYLFLALWEVEGGGSSDRGQAGGTMRSMRMVGVLALLLLVGTILMIICVVAGLQG